MWHRLYNVTAYDFFLSDTFSLLEDINHSNVYSLVTQLCEMTLFDYLKKKPDLSLKYRMNILLSIIEAVQAFDREVAHFDLKPGNIFLDVGKDDLKPRVKVADFGIARRGMAQHKVGTAGFGSPEQFAANAGAESDIFSVGKVAILVIFEWDLAWHILWNPVDKKDAERFFKMHNILEELHVLIRSMLEVKQKLKNLAFEIDAIYALFGQLYSAMARFSPFDKRASQKFIFF